MNPTCNDCKWAMEVQYGYVKECRRFPPITFESDRTSAYPVVVFRASGLPGFCQDVCGWFERVKP